MMYDDDHFIFNVRDCWFLFSNGGWIDWLSPSIQFVLSTCQKCNNMEEKIIETGIKKGWGGGATWHNVRGYCIAGQKKKELSINQFSKKGRKRIKSRQIFNG